MTKVEDIERAVSKLAPNELAKFRVWFEEYDAGQFDAKIEKDIKRGKLDRLADNAISDLAEGNAREL